VYFQIKLRHWILGTGRLVSISAQSHCMAPVQSSCNLLPYKEHGHSRTTVFCKPKIM